MDRMLRKKARTGLILISSAAIALLVYSGLGYKPINDVGIDAISFATIMVSMIAGPWAGCITGLVWGLAIADHACLPVLLTVIPRVAVGISAHYLYQYFKKIHKRCPFNVYRASGLVALGFSITTSLSSVLLYGPKDWGTMLFKTILETSLPLIVMAIFIKELRKHHILNGVKYKRRKQ